MRTFRVQFKSNTPYCYIYANIEAVSFEDAVQHAKAMLKDLNKIFAEYNFQLYDLNEERKK